MIYCEETTMKRLWPFLLLNVAVSAATVLIVLWVWSATHSQPLAQANGGNSSQAAMISAATQMSMPPMNAKLFEVQAIFGAGDLTNEYVHFLYLGSDPLDLENWQVRDEHGNSYTFPAFVIYKDGAFDLYTQAGTNSTIELYMAKTAALWKSGESLAVYDPAGNKRLIYPIP
jgi:hypothetical protein